MGAHMERAIVLYQQARHDLAEREFRQELAANSESPHAHAFLALCLIEQKKAKEATEEAKAAIALGPDLPLAHYAAARVFHQRGVLKEARLAIDEAIRLDPEDADLFAVLSGILLDQGKNREALSAAEQGLALDPEQVACTNLRALALVQMGRKEQAAEGVEAALARDPENAVSHANMGWTMLHRADYPKALEHFRESLRIDPTLDWAREGLVEALKARHLLYGLMLRYFLWMSRLSGRAQWGVVLIGYFGYRFLRDAARHNPSLAPWVTPLLVAYLAFAALTWLASPLFNLLLRLNRFGRLALSAQEIEASNLVGLCLLSGVVCALLWLPTGHPTLLYGAIALGALALPGAAIYQCRPGRRRGWMTRYTGTVASLALLGLVISLAGLGRGFGEGLLVLSLAGSAFSGWVANALILSGSKGGG